MTMWWWDDDDDDNDDIDIYKTPQIISASYSLMWRNELKKANVHQEVEATITILCFQKLKKKKDLYE